MKKVRMSGLYGFFSNQEGEVKDMLRTEAHIKILRLFLSAYRSTFFLDRHLICNPRTNGEEDWKEKKEDSEHQGSHHRYIE